MVNINRPRLTGDRVAYDGKMKPLREHQAANREKIGADQGTDLIPEHIVRRKTQKFMPEQMYYMDQGAQLGFNVTGRAFDPAAHRRMMGDEFGHQPPSFIPAESQTIVNSPEDVDRAARVASIIQNAKLKSLVDHAMNGLSEDVMKAYDDLEFDRQVAAAGVPEPDPDVYDPEANEQRVAIRESVVTKNRTDDARWAWGEYFLKGDGSHQFDNLQRAIDDSIEKGIFNAKQFANDAFEEYKTILPDIENQYRAQDMVNGFAKQVVDDYVRKLQAYTDIRKTIIENALQKAMRQGTADQVLTLQHRLKKLQNMAATRVKSAQAWQTKIGDTSLRNPLKAVNDILKFADKNGGMSDAQRRVADGYRGKLAHQENMTAQDMLRQQVAMKRLYAEMGEPKPEWLGTMISRTQYAAEQEIQNKARRLQQRADNKQGDNLVRPTVFGKQPPKRQPPKRPPGPKPPAPPGQNTQPKTRGWFR
ncbi:MULTISPECIES: hypothetical protein [unclassified Pannonibacter]|uniref:hypothetical protein n=1 Tax=unclassified Pannonibacter TaxID=2627228 RepID=UPI001649212D|nr:MULTISPECIES: hypothetical protein [unclassified Pannonibacter]